MNDFGSAVPVGEPTFFDGALQRAPEHILQATKSMKQYYPKRSDDFEMIVRLLYERINTSEFASIRGILNVDQISEFWKVIRSFTLLMLLALIVHQIRLSAGFWKMMTDYAKQTDDDNPQNVQEAIDKLKRGCCFVLYGGKEESSEELELMIELGKKLHVGDN